MKAIDTLSLGGPGFKSSVNTIRVATGNVTYSTVMTPFPSGGAIYALFIRMISLG